MYLKWHWQEEKKLYSIYLLIIIIIIAPCSNNIILGILCTGVISNSDSV